MGKYALRLLRATGKRDKPADANPARPRVMPYPSMPGQKLIIEQVGALLDLQRKQTVAAVRQAELSHLKMRGLMIGLGLAALLTGGAIAWFVNRQAPGRPHN